MTVQTALMLFGSFFVMLFAGIPISMGIGIASIITAIMSDMDRNIFALIAAQRCFSGCDSFSLLALPFSSLGGNIMNKEGIAKRLARLARLLVGWVPGYLTATNVLTNMFLGAVSGSSVAATSTMGFITSPLELDKGYSPNYSAAVNICSALTGILIPPSGPLILYSITTGGVSVAALFMGGHLTGALSSIAVAGLAVFLAVRGGYKASAAREEDPIWKIVLGAVPSLLAAIVIMDSTLTGIFTATEAGVIIYLYCTLLVIIHREMGIKAFCDLLADMMKSSVTVLFLIAASSIMSYVMSYSDIPAATSEGLVSVSNNRYMIILIMNVSLLMAGMFLDLTPAVLIFTPIFLPVATSVGINPVHFGPMLTMDLGIGSITLPVDSCLFVGCGVGRVRTERITKYIVPILTTMMIFLFPVSFIPTIPPLMSHLCSLMPSMWW